MKFVGLCLLLIAGVALAVMPYVVINPRQVHELTGMLQVVAIIGIGFVSTLGLVLAYTAISWGNKAMRRKP